MSWGYSIRDIDRSKAKADGIELALNELGADDWELVGVMKVTGTIDRYFLKRENKETLTEKVTGLIRSRSDSEE